MSLRPASVLLSLVLLLNSCAPVVKSPGPEIEPPRLTDGALITADGVSLPLRSWLPVEDGKPVEPKAVIVALHGMNDYSNAFDEPGKSLARKGIAVFAYDQRGFGQAPERGYWAGNETLAADAATAVRLVHSRYPDKPVYLMGESMGGAVALLSLTGQDPPAVAGVILSAPAVWDRGSMNLFQRGLLWLTSHTMPWLTLTGRGLDVKPSDNIEMLRALGRDPLVIKETRVDAIKGVCDLMDEAQEAAPKLHGPVLVLYGEHDEIVPKEPSLRMMTRLPDSPTPPVEAIYANGWHMLLRDLQADVVLDDVVAWIARPGAPLPSGADVRAREVLATDRK